MYERPINPPEPVLADVAVNVTGYSSGPIHQISSAIGGDAHWSEERPDMDGYRAFAAYTIVEDCEDYSTAEDIVHNLIAESLSDSVDIENLIVDAVIIEDDSDYDYDDPGEW